jgi:putative nucleotidyltransferase with HDIG domain
MVGRGPQCQIQLADESLSRTHCLFGWEGDEPYVEDLGSTNGTVVNGLAVKRQRLTSGDVVRLGPTVCITVSRSDVPQAAGGRPQGLVAAPVRPAEPIDTSAVRLKRRVDMSKTAMFTAVVPAAPPELTRLQRDLATIYRVVDLFTTEHDLSRLFRVAIDTIMEVTGADRGAIVMREDEDGPLATVASCNRLFDGPGATVTVSRAILEEGLKGLSLITDSAFRDERFRARASVMLQNIHAAMCVPLESHDKVLGVIYVDSLASDRRFLETDLELLTAIGRQAGIAIQRAVYLRQTRDLFYSTIKTLAMAIEAKDRYTRGHSERVTQLSVAIAEAMELDAEVVDTVRLAALLHDVGKIGVAEAVLNKPGGLTDEEYAAIQAHPTIGAQIVQHVPKIGRVLEGVKHHHEKWNGKGYPDRLSGEDIPLTARIIAVADAYDAMSSHRVYRKGLNEEVVFEEIRRNAGIQFDPTCVDAFFRAVESGRIARPLQLLAEQASFKDLLKPPENSDVQGVKPPRDMG